MTGSAIDVGSAPPARGRRAELLDSHSRAAAIVFWLKSRGLIVRRILSNLAAGELSRRYGRSAVIPEGAHPLATDEHPIYTESDPRERELELGKVNEPWDIGLMPAPENPPLKILLIEKADRATEAGGRSPKQKAA